MCFSNGTTAFIFLADFYVFDRKLRHGGSSHETRIEISLRFEFQLELLRV